MAILGEGANSASALYEVENSLKLESDNSEYLVRAQSQGNQKTWTFSTWIKRTEICKSVHTYTGSQPYQALFGAGSASSDNNTQLAFYGDGSNDDYLVMYLDNGGSRYLHGVVARAFRDTTAWYHIVWAIDTTQSTASERSKVYVNGVLQSLSSETDPVLNSSTRVSDNGGNIAIGSLGYAPNLLLNGYLAETAFVDGGQLTASDFGKFDVSGIWVPKDLSSITFGTRGFYLKYDNSSSLGADSSGNGNNFTATNISSADQATDTPTNVFCNYFDKAEYTNNQVAAEAIFRRGNTWFETTRATGRWRTAVSNWGVTKGKWYAEFSADTSTFMIGVGSYDKMDGTLSTTTHAGAFNTHLGSTDHYSIGFYAINGRLFENGSQTLNWGNGFNANDILSIALDMDNGYVYFGGGGTWQNSGDPTSGSSGTGGVSLPYYTTDTYYMGVTLNTTPTYARANWGGYTEISIASSNTDANGYGNFEYSVPTGYYAMCTKNLAEFG